jgi:hypothetical protein
MVRPKRACKPKTYCDYPADPGIPRYGSSPEGGSGIQALR